MTDKITPHYRLDLQGEPCPYPAVSVVEFLPTLDSGDILEVISDCPQSINNIPVDAKSRGYDVLSIEQYGPTIRYFIKKP